ncbi:hypothetical protein RCL1_002725 [Eukaryota sp. TZLM3-RCL]
MHFRQRSFPSDSHYKFAVLEPQESSFVKQPTRTNHGQESFVNKSDSLFDNPSLLEPVEDEIPLLDELGLSFNTVLKSVLDFVHPHKIPSLQSPDVFGPVVVVFCTALVSSLITGSVAPFATFYSITLFCTLLLSALFSLLSPSISLKPSASLFAFGLSLVPTCLSSILFPFFPRSFFSFFVFIILLSSSYGSMKAARSVSMYISMGRDFSLVFIPFLVLNFIVVFIMLTP